MVMQRRLLLLPLLLLAHLLLIGMLVAPPLPLPSSPERAMVVVARAAPVAPPQAVPAPVETAIAVRVEAVEPAIDIAPAVGAPSPSASGCDLTAMIQSALRASEPVRAALARMPAGARSASDALVVWQRGWADPAAVGGTATLGPIRAAVVASIAAAPADCQAAPVVGPRLLFVDSGARFIVLAFGSGTWAWSDLLA